MSKLPTCFGLPASVVVRGIQVCPLIYIVHAENLFETCIGNVTVTCWAVKRVSRSFPSTLSSYAATLCRGCLVCNSFLETNCTELPH
uniref:Putative secreted protein n=1 Tax=Rhipicephalus microplus TaxID=6941 RepID=A0A6G5A4K3_RHIMP